MYSDNIQIDSPFNNLLRKEHVLIAGINPRNQVLLSRKREYPDNIYRLPGGGKEASDLNYLHSAKRETLEELGLEIELNAFQFLFDYRVSATDKNGNSYELLTHILLFRLSSKDEPQAKDDIHELRFFSISELELLSKRYLEISKFSIGKNDSKSFLWQDYGKVYGPIHHLVATHLNDL